MYQERLLELSNYNDYTKYRVQLLLYQTVFPIPLTSNDNKKIYFGASGYEHFTNGHLDIKRRDAYLLRHQKKENWNNPNSAGYWSARFLWLYPTYKEAYEIIKKELIKKKYL